MGKEAGLPAGREGLKKYVYRLRGIRRGTPTKMNLISG